MTGIQGLDDFLNDLTKLQNIKNEIPLWLEALSFQFLEEVQREIIRSQTVDTRRLLNSFDKGNEDGVFEYSNGGLTLEVGTNLEYARFANDGHMTVRPDTPGAKRLKNGQLARWVPGYWRGGEFVYDKGAKTGMLLKAKWVEGSHYFDTAFKIWEAMFGKSLEKKFAMYLNNPTMSKKRGK
jgi:hypothetical protein